MIASCLRRLLDSLTIGITSQSSVCDGMHNTTHSQSGLRVSLYEDDVDDVESEDSSDEEIQLKRHVASWRVVASSTSASASSTSASASSTSASSTWDRSIWHTCRP